MGTGYWEQVVFSRQHAVSSRQQVVCPWQQHIANTVCFVVSLKKPLPHVRQFLTWNWAKQLSNP